MKFVLLYYITKFKINYTFKPCSWKLFVKSVYSGLILANFSKWKQCCLMQMISLNSCLMFSFFPLFLSNKYSPTRSGIDAGITLRPSRYNRIATVDHGSLADRKVPQPVQVVTLARVVRPLRQRAHTGPRVIRNCIFLGRGTMINFLKLDERAI